jgi:ferredoxin
MDVEREQLKPKIDFKLCNGNGFCTLICPEVFKVDENRHTKIINPDPEPKLHDKVLLAVRTCPLKAISLEEADEVVESTTPNTP